MEIEESYQFDGKKEITLLSIESLMPNLIKRKLRFRQNAENADEDERIIIHLQYLTWPDHGAPDEQEYKIIGKI